MKKIHTLLLLLSILLTSTPLTAKTKARIPANKKEIIDRFLDGTLDPSYVPAAFFIHFGADSKTGDAAVNAHLQHLLRTNQDIVKVQFEQGLKRIKNLDKQETWDSIKPLPQDYYAPTLEIIHKINDIAGKDVYILPTIYSPYQVARQAIGDENFVMVARQHPNELKRMLQNYADCLNWLVRQCKAIGIQGFYTCTQGGEMKFYSTPGFFDNFIKPYDLMVMNECNKDTKVTILHICDWEGPYDDLSRFCDYPGTIVNTPMFVNGKPFTPQDGYKLFHRPVLGGLDRHQEIVKSTESDLVNHVREVLKAAPAGKIMLGAECTVGGAPMSNIHAAVNAAHHY